MALLTAVFWGLCYACAGQALKYVDKSVYLSLSFVANLIFWSGWFTIHNFRGKISLESFEQAKWWIVTAIAASIVGNYLSLKAIELKDATSASVVEISYPIWCAIFTFMLLGHNPFTLKSALGMALVILGMALVISGTIVFVLGEK